MKREFNPGDKVKCVEGYSNYHLVKGHEYTILDTAPLGNVLLKPHRDCPGTICDRKGRCGPWDADRFELIRSGNEA